MAESQASTTLDERFFDDPSQLSQLLRQRAGSDRAVHFTTSTDSPQSGGAASIATFASLPPLTTAVDGQKLPVVPTQPIPSPRRVAPAGDVRHAKLSTHRSAPTESGFVRETDGAFKMYHSFGGMHAPGDTQPDSQIYHQYTSGAFSTSDKAPLRKIVSPKSLFTEHEDEDDGDSPSDGVDMVASSPEQHSPRATSPTVVHDDDAFEPAAPSIYAPTSPLKFETPAVAGRKRDSSGHMLSSAVRTNTTPGTVESIAAFPGFGMGGMAPMSLTQAWQNTQAPTSPMVHDASGDMAFTRPSPNFTHIRQSSPGPALSSPIKATQQDDHSRSDPVLRSSSEPRAEYVSMKESQERRRRTSGERPPRLLEEDSWEQPSAARLRMQTKKGQEQWKHTATRSYVHISPPNPLSPESGKKRSATRAVLSPTKKHTARHVERLQDDAMGETVTELCAANTLLGEDSPDELSQERAFTTRTVKTNNSKRNGVQVPKTSSHPTRTQSEQPPRNSSQGAGPSSQLARESQPRATASQPVLTGNLRPHSSRDSVAIMDSQPDVTANDDSIPRPKSLRFPSSPSVNQYSINQTTMATKTGYTSQVISSSVPPLPPVSSQDEAAVPPEEEMTLHGEEGVPSSPPITAIDEDLTYDEHVYDEYAAEAEVRESVEPEVSDGNGSNLGDDLPEPKSEPDKDQEDEELDLIQPRKVDMATVQEVPEALEQGAPLGEVFEDLLSARSPAPEHGEVFENDFQHPARVQRQATVPETDALEETQPTFFPEDVLIAHNDLNHDPESGPPIDVQDHTGSSEPFHIARKQRSGSQDDQPPLSSHDIEGDTLPGTERIRTLQDIYDMPETQQSSTEDMEIPRLSGLDEEDDFMANSSPAAPSAKRRKVTYTGKHNAPRSPRRQAETLQPRRDASLSARQGSPPTSSAHHRESRGATAASKARDEAEGSDARRATLKSKPIPRPSRNQTKSGSLKAVSRDVIADLSVAADSPSKSKSSAGKRRSTPVTPTKLGKRSRDVDDNVDMPNAVEERDGLAESTPEPFEVAVQRASDSGEQITGNIILPNRVFASWPGSHFYPATCLGRVAGQQLRIRFDEDNITKLDATQVRALDLQPGDQVKVDETGRKKYTYIVVGFKDKIRDPNAPDLPMTDRHGYATVVLEEKRRDSLPAAKAAKPAELISAPISSIYITTQLWARLRGRSFNFSPLNSPSKSASRIGTPVQHDPLDTPSFSRRGTTAPSLLKGATARAASVTSSSTRSGNGVFANMAFVLTSTGTNVDKDEISRSIKTNGGLVLEHGFHELFDHESSGAVPSSQSGRRSESGLEGSTSLTLKPTYKDLGFVALISDSHSRSTKYIQALALNVPCLHLRWVQDSLQASRAAPFLKYLLPAGVSKFLDPNGVVRSRTMTPYDPAAEDLAFNQTMSNRDLLLQDQAVLLVTGKSKKEIEKRQPFIFLTHALGSAHVGRCTDLTAATDLLHNGQWDWVYVDNGEAGVLDAAAELFGMDKPAVASKSKKGRKRKRDGTEEKEELVARGVVSGKKVKITCSEFVIQSLILGALIEE
ncbi:hypothetical protein DE146DRAFT_682756 [Phaeosphaeria sp. MPI-PUGE-AT-0046c]|nr:hypothetical protein DE146DRAFT_682756 [Phaeosphaeria sp. MPI-PUGE-AT-0046c]